MSHENRRCRQPRWSANACSGVLLLLLACSASAGAQENPLEATGVQPSRAYVSVLPWEQIDAYSGNLILTFTDLVLPGNAGFDLALTRTYNNKGGGAHWTFNPGKVTHADIQGSNLHNPQIVTGEDARGEPTFETAQGSGIFRTRRYWEYHRATHVASLPNGVTYTYDYFWNTEHRNERYLTEMRDAFGNTVTFFYVQPDPAQPPRLDYLVQDLGNGQTREVTFTYTAAGQRETMTYLERTWTYTWDGSQLTAVTPPVGAGWAYGYEGPWLTSVTTPNGGVVTYVYEWQTFSGHQTLILSQRTASEREVHDGPWYFWYHGSYTWVINDANETVYRFDTVSPLDDPGTLVRRETWHDGTCVEAQDLTWQASVALGLVDWSYDDPPAPYAPLLQSSTITRQGHAFVTTSLYKQTDLNDYGQPWQVTEDGDFTRVTTRTFRHGFPTFIRGKLESETVTVAGQSFTRSFAYDDQGFLWADETYGVVTTFTRTSVGNVASTTDADNHTTTVSHAWGVVENTSTPAYPITRVINPDGTVASETRGGATTSYSYDALGRVRWMTPLVGAATETRYDPAGATIETQRDVSWVRQTLDGFGRVIGAEDAVGVVTAREYDGVGRLARETAPYYSQATPHWTSWDYDALDRVTKQTNPDDTVVQYGYAYVSSGLEVTITDENLHVTTQQWEASGSPAGARLATVTEPSGDGGGQETTAYAYDTLGALTDVTHPNGRTRHWEYETSTHRLLSETHPESGTVHYDAYSDAGRLTQMHDAAGQTLVFEYDGNGRLTRVHPAGGSDTTFDYDAWDRRKTATTTAVQTTWAYDPQSKRLNSRTDVVDGHSFVTMYEVYDDRDNVTKIKYPSGREVSFAYDAANRVTRVGDVATGLPYADTVSYHPSGALSGYHAGNDTTYALTVNARGWPDHLTSGPLDLTYHYDSAGNVVQLDDGRGAGWTQAFLYDSVDRLTSATGVYGGLGFSYDAVGNRTGAGYEYNQATQRLTSRTAGGVTTTFGYDNNGSLVSQAVNANVTTFTYTPQRMVETVTVNGATTTYQYDGEQRRTTQTGAGQTVYTIHDGSGRLLSTSVEQNGVLRWDRDELYLGGQLLGAVRAWQPDPGEDYDQDHRSDVVVYRPSTGTWFILSSASSYTTYTAYGFGGQASDVPVPGDFDGDGIPDLGIYRPSTGTWYVLKSSTGFTQWDWFGWGGVGDLPAAGDFDQDGRTDAAVYRTATGEWFVKPSSGATPWSVTLGGASGDVPAVGDYDGDRRADVAVYRPSTATWLILTSSSGYVTLVTYQFGATNDVPVPADVDGDGTTDLAVYRPSTGTWFALTSSSGFTTWTSQGWGALGDVPVPATDFDGDGRADYVVYRPSTGQWFVKPSGGGIAWSVQFGASGDVAVQPVVAPGVPAHPTVYVDYYHLDALGSVRAVTGELGTVLARHDFLPFGEEWTGVPSRETRLFAGQERDAETGLDYFGARYYEPSIGRFTTIDPVYTWKDNLADPQRWNRYAYVRDNPLKFRDLDGREIGYVYPLSGGILSPYDPTFPKSDHPIRDTLLLGAVTAGALFGGGFLIDAVEVGTAGRATAAAVAASPVGSRAAEYSAQLLERFSTKLTNVSKVLGDAAHIEAALKDMQGTPITIGGRTYDHLPEVQNYLAGLSNTINGLKSLILNENTPGSIRAEALELLTRATSLYNKVVQAGVKPKG